MIGKKNNTKAYLLTIAIIIIIAPVVWILIDRMEGETPQIRFELLIPSIGKSLKLPVALSDQKSGLRRFWVELVKDGKEHQIVNMAFESAGFLAGGRVAAQNIPIEVNPKSLGVTDGKALLRMALWDYSWRKWGKGNQTYIEREVTIDTVSPRIEVLSRAHNVNQGGAGLVIYKLSEPCVKNGVLVGENFFPGHSGHYSDPNIHMAFFALSHTQGPDTKLMVTAVDTATNEAVSSFPHHINARKFKADKIKISDSFLQSKMPEFAQAIPNGEKLAPLEIFLLVNEDLREANERTVFSHTMKSEPKIYWEGEFLSLPNSANRAGFADHRSYIYNGKIIDGAYHMGVDLASVALSPIPAANAGKIIFTGDIGIYGGTVLIDHGFGVVSLYGHMSSIDVAKDQMVSKGDIIGKTGLTGLAGGDHLHFGMIVHNTEVNPIEWWDGTWIKNNIADKIADVNIR